MEDLIQNVGFGPCGMQNSEEKKITKLKKLFGFFVNFHALLTQHSKNKLFRYRFATGDVQISINVWRLFAPTTILEPRVMAVRYSP